MNWLRELLSLVMLVALIIFANLTVILTYEHFKLVKEVNRLKVECQVTGKR